MTKRLYCFFFNFAAANTRTCSDFLACFRTSCWRFDIPFTPYMVKRWQYFFFSLTTISTFTSMASFTIFCTGCFFFNVPFSPVMAKRFYRLCSTLMTAGTSKVKYSLLCTSWFFCYCAAIIGKMTKRLHYFFFSFSTYCTSTNFHTCFCTGWLNFDFTFIPCMFFKWYCLMFCA